MPGPQQDAPNRAPAPQVKRAVDGGTERKQQAWQQEEASELADVC